MPWVWILAGVGVTLLVWAIAVAVLAAAGRGAEARALVRFVPDCLVLFRRLIGDRRIPRRRKLVLAALLGYLALPFDVVPDFIPVAGQVDDVIVVALGLRFVLRSAGAGLVREHWPGPPESLAAVTVLAFGPFTRATPSPRR
jgi:uncharacterized membrane protein YkvA (DUF1232 family)